MRLTLFLALTALTLGACRDKGADNAINQDAGLTADNIVSNDITAIDAVTAQAANMAADVDYADALNALSNNGADSGAPGAKPAPRPRADAPAPATNDTAPNNSQ